jgi:hypothetical protein
MIQKAGFRLESSLVCGFRGGCENEISQGTFYVDVFQTLIAAPHYAGLFV